MPGLLLVNARIATMRGGRYSMIENGVLHAVDGRIRWIGEAKDFGASPAAAATVDAKGALVTPGLVDCHTHLVYAGDRAAEFEQRLRGVTYEEIARAGGGILATVRATRAAGERELREASARRLEALCAEGVTTVEIKSGYGLDLANESKCLRVARSLARAGVRVRTTLLAAHALPPEFAGRAEDYVQAICEEIIPAIARAGLADAVDAFCETIAFTPAQTRRVFECARRHGLRVKLHADQLSDLGGAALAAQFHALSADHLEHANEAGIAAMARQATVAVLLPGAFYYLRETRVPPVDALRRHGVPIAIASDCNPGTSPIASPVAIMSMACTLLRLTPEEALAGMTLHAARALGLEADLGSLEPGKLADAVVWDADHPAQIGAQIGMVRPRTILFEGRVGLSSAQG